MHGLVLVESWVHRIVDAKGGDTKNTYVYKIIVARIVVGALLPTCQVLFVVANVFCMVA